MKISAKKIIILIFAATLTLGAFFTIAAVRLIREIERVPSYRYELAPLNDEELKNILPSNISLPITQNFIDLDGDEVNELVIGFSEENKPRFLMYRYLNSAWALEDEFDFPINDRFYANSNEWSILSGASSFEKRDINGDGREEIFTRVNVGSEFFHAKAIIILSDNELVWLPMVKSSQAVLPIFLEGNTTSEVRRLLLEGVREREGLAIIGAYGFFDEQSQSEEWIYEAYVERGSLYEYSAEKSAEFANQNR